VVEEFIIINKPKRVNFMNLADMDNFQFPKDIPVY